MEIANFKSWLLISLMLDLFKMPVIGKIQGIILRMFYADHAPPHFHATHSEKEGLFKLDDLEMLRGDLATKDQKKVKKWAEPRKAKLKEMWKSQDIHNID
jgi:hypothetical protein